MRQIAVAFLFSMIAATALPAHADFADDGAGPATLTVAELLGQCASQYNTDYGFCAGYISAVADQMLGQGIDGMRVCSFGMARSQQFVDLVQNYAAKNPDYGHIPARDFVASALVRAFPCAR